MKTSRIRSKLPALVAISVLGLVAADAWARPGGGQSFSRPGGGSGGGGGGGGDFAGLLIWLLIRHPAIGIPVLVVVGIVWLVGMKSQREAPSWSTGGFGGEDGGAVAHLHRRPSNRRRLNEVARSHDPNFSLILFEDFIYALYSRAHELRAGSGLHALSVYLSEGARNTLESGPEGLGRVHSIVVGSMQIAQVQPPSGSEGMLGVSVVFEANYTEVDAEGRSQAYWVKDRWRLGRKSSARTRPPDALTVEGCPNCGATLEKHGRDGRCSYCDTRIDTGDFDWVVEQIQTLARQRRGPQLTGTVPEVGTHLPTLSDPGLDAGLAALAKRDPSFEPAGLMERVKLIHRRLTQAWTEKSWRDVRPFVSDQLFQTQLYWIETYRSQGLTNVLEDFRLTRAQLVAALSDRWYDAITVRVWGTGKDYTVRDGDGQVVGGHADRERPYSEYWTLIRRTNVQGAARSDENCPSCGAGLNIAMAGTCAYCGAKITSGEFDWVLSKIEQDEAYGG